MMNDISLDFINKTLLNNFSTLLKEFQRKNERDNQMYVDSFWFSTTIAVIGVVGVLGNILNLTILTRRRLVMSLDQHSSSYGLFSLAVSDFVICLLIIPSGFLSDNRESVGTKDRIVLYYKIYGVGLINFFVMVSMWQILNMAIQRYIIVVYPLKARLILTRYNCVATIIMIYVLCFFMTLPHFIHVKVRCVHYDSYYYEYGSLWRSKTREYFRLYIRWCWPIIAVFVPATVLLFCNFRLVRNLIYVFRCRRSYLRTSYGGKNKSRQSNGFIVTLTLVTIVIVVIFCIAPVEVIRYVNPYETLGSSLGNNIAMAGNLLQGIGFASNFLLYVIVNGRFRHTLWNMLGCEKTRDKSMGRVHFCPKPMCVYTKPGVPLSEPVKTTLNLNVVKTECNTV